MPIVWIVRLFFIAALVGTLAFLFSMGFPKQQIKGYVGLSTAVIVFLWLGVEALFDRRRLSLLRSRLEFLGFSPRESEDIHYEPTPRDRNLALAVNARADWNGVPIRVTEFSFQQGTGKSTVKRRVTQAAMAAPDLPEFRLRPAGFRATGDLADLRILPSSDKSVEARFARRWLIICPEGGDAFAQFPEPLSEWLLDSPRHESWASADGELSCSWSRTCTPDQAEQLLARLATFLRLYRA